MCRGEKEGLLDLARLSLHAKITKKTLSGSTENEFAGILKEDAEM